VVDFYQAFGYFSGLLLVRPDLEPTALWRTAALVHGLDAILCCVIANYSHRNKLVWTVAGLALGIWALCALFLLPARRDPAKKKAGIAS
jgi:hypothetical protein